MSTSYIKRVEISKLWGKYDIVWDNLHPDVNILVGINGSGKSTVINSIKSCFDIDFKRLKKSNIESIRLINSLNEDLVLNSGARYDYPTDENFVPYIYINTFDVPTNKSKLRNEESPLMLELRNLISIAGTNSFTDYRLKATQSAKIAIEVNKRIDNLFKIIDIFFENTGKTIEIDLSNKLVFKIENECINLDQLSAGEKQLLLILFKVFLMDEKPYVLLMDEPEISMHIGWQQNLIETIRSLNPNCQLIIATHSPSIFGKGWGDKITFMENLFVK
jgi:predicted ATP-binding protein involved in virulence